MAPNEGLRCRLRLEQQVTDVVYEDIHCEFDHPTGVACSQDIYLQPDPETTNSVFAGGVVLSAHHWTDSQLHAECVAFPQGFLNEVTDPNTISSQADSFFNDLALVWHRVSSGGVTLRRLAEIHGWGEDPQEQLAFILNALRFLEERQPNAVIRLYRGSVFRNQEHDIAEIPVRDFLADSTYSLINQYQGWALAPEQFFPVPSRHPNLLSEAEVGFDAIRSIEITAENPYRWVSSNNSNLNSNQRLTPRDRRLQQNFQNFADRDWNGNVQSLILNLLSNHKRPVRFIIRDEQGRITKRVELDLGEALENPEDSLAELVRNAENVYLSRRNPPQVFLSFPDPKVAVENEG